MECHFGQYLPSYVKYKFEINFDDLKQWKMVMIEKQRHSLQSWVGVISLNLGFHAISRYIHTQGTTLATQSKATKT